MNHTKLSLTKFFYYLKIIKFKFSSLLFFILPFTFLLLDNIFNLFSTLNMNFTLLK